MNGRSSASPARGESAELSRSEQPSAVATLELPSFESVYTQYFDFVWSSARRLGVGPAAMDDIVQEIFMVIHDKLRTLRQPQSLRSFIYGIVRRTVSHHHRSRRTRGELDAAFAQQVKTHQAAQPTPLELTEHNEDAKLLWDLLGELDAPKREVLMLAEIDGMTAPEISEALEVPLNTAYSRLRTARLAFEAALERRLARDRSGVRS